MLIRFVVKNLYSFGQQTEFNMLPNKRYKTLDHHKYSVAGLDLLKMTAMYGANAAGKSNFVKAIELLQNIIVDDELPYDLESYKYKFNDTEDKSVLFAIEFIQDGIPFYYAIQILNGIVQHEELYISGVGRNKDNLIFERKTDTILLKSSISFYNDFYTDSKNATLAEVIEESLCKPEKPIFKLLTTLKNSSLNKVVQAFVWFKDKLQVIEPSTKVMALAHLIDQDKTFKNFTQEMLCSFDVGINSIDSEKKKFDVFFKDIDDEDKNSILKSLDESSRKIIGLFQGGKELIVSKEDSGIFVKQLKLTHSDNAINFALDEESDGTIRLLDFIPAFKDIVSDQKVYIIDEIERSVHPLLIKKLIEKFSLDDKTAGQLIFTTHESNLLDQTIFRKDEIWFAEKDKSGCTDLYSLSDYREHNTIDIQKGYLNGRYGSIPFLANLDDLNWH